ncbi:MAG: MFS transporter [Streptosporangiales bacterium]|nr:MFS transporter [Streptosporangiales bacterium]
MQTLVVPLLPHLPGLLGRTPDDVAWLATATLLAGAVTMPVFGRLGDMFGKRRMLIAGLVLLVVGSVLCALTDELNLLIAGRVLQGAAMAVVPLGISIIRDELPPERVGGGIALVSASLGIGGGAGLPLAGLAAERLDWHMVFWIAAGVGAIGLVAVAWRVPESPVRTPGRVDVPGMVILTALLLCLLLPVSKGGAWGWGSPLTLGLLAGFLVLTVLFAVVEPRRAEPLVDLRTTLRRPVLLTNIVSVLTGFAMFSGFIATTQLIQAPAETGFGLGQGIVAAGLALAPGAVMMSVVSPLSARMAARTGPRLTLLLGSFVNGAGFVLLIAYHDTLVQAAAAATVSSMGAAMAYSSIPALIMRAVPVSETGAANGLNALMRTVGTSTASAVVGMLLASWTRDVPALGALPAHGAFLLIFWLGAATSVASGLLTLAIPVGGRRG